MENKMEIVSENGKIDSITLLVNVSEYMNFKDLVQLRMVCKDLRPHVTGISFWNKIAVLQENREAKGKRVVLFQQFLMSRENALLLPPSKLYK
jgi:hypothetical protein